MATNTQMQPTMMAPVQPQNPTMLSSQVDRRFMPKIPATTAPSAAAKLPMLNVNSSRFTCSKTLLYDQRSFTATNHIYCLCGFIKASSDPLPMDKVKYNFQKNTCTTRFDPTLAKEIVHNYRFAEQRANSFTISKSVARNQPWYPVLLSFDLK